MNSKEYHMEEERQTHEDDLRAEANTRERVVDITFRVIVNTHDDQLAFESAFDTLNDEDLNDYYHSHKVLK